MIQLASWAYLLLIPVILLGWLKLRPYLEQRTGRMKFSDTRLLEGAPVSFRVFSLQTLPYVRILMLTIMLLAIARPQYVNKTVDVTTHGVDIILAVDVSGTMAAEDFKPRNRLETAKGVLKDFIRRRTHDRIGLVIFGGRSYTQVPLTLDYGLLETFIDRLEVGMIEDGTAIGMAIANSVNRLRKSDARSRIIVLLTDGVNNAGSIDPLTAARLAHSLHIRIYTIGVGKKGGAPIPYTDPVYGKQYYRNYDGSLVLTTLDDEALRKIAAIGNGKYFRAESGSELLDIYAGIDALEKTKITTKEYSQTVELAPYLLYGAILLLIADMLLSVTWLRKVP